MTQTIVSIFMVGVLLALPMQWAYAKRVALVIGNAQYKNLTPLSNPENDAKAIAQRLGRLGFELLKPIDPDEDNENHGAQLNLTDRQFIHAKLAFVEAAKGAEVAFFYYAGHGTQLGYPLQAALLPINAVKPKNKGDLAYLEKQSHKLQMFMNELNGQARLTVAVFDACRDIPDLHKVRSSLSQGQQNRGLSRINIRAKGQIIAYAGAAGQVVSDGWFSTHSPYTKQLITVLDENPQQEFVDLFRDVATRVDEDISQYPEINIKGVPPRKYYLLKPDNESRLPNDADLLQQAITLLDGDDASRYSIAIGQLYLLADKQNSEALFRLAIAHYVGRGVSSNTTLACRFLKQAADKGHRQAQREYDELPGCQ